VFKKISPDWVNTYGNIAQRADTRFSPVVLKITLYVYNELMTVMKRQAYTKKNGALPGSPESDWM